MVKKRYLIFFSYIGTQFRGLQRQRPRNAADNADPSTIQGLLEYAISRTHPKNEVILRSSSRTDQGVHAIRTAGTVDLEYDYNYHPERLHYFINRFFHDTDLDIRVNEVRRVSDDFDCRRLPLYRKYIYRIAVLKEPSLYEDKLVNHINLPIPITEHYRTYFVRNHRFDVEALKEAANLFIGTKDFFTFVAKPKFHPPEKPTIKTIDEFYIEPAQPAMSTHFDEYFNYWHITCRGKSFLYKQVRRMVTTLLTVAQGNISLKYVQSMIEQPSPKKWVPSLKHAPAHGLYLADVVYDPVDLQFTIPECELEVEKAETDTVAVTLEQKKELLKKRLQELKERRELYS